MSESLGPVLSFSSRSESERVVALLHLHAGNQDGIEREKSPLHNSSIVAGAQSNADALTSASRPAGKVAAQWKTKHVKKNLTAKPATPQGCKDTNEFVLVPGNR